MQAQKPQFNKSELLAELTNKHTAETSAKLDTLKQVGIETVVQLEKLNKVMCEIDMPKISDKAELDKKVNKLFIKLIEEMNKPCEINLILE